MTANSVVVQGVITSDGTLELESKVPLPAGKVRVTVRPVPELPLGDPFFDLLRGIWAARAGAGLTPRGAEEIETQRRKPRDESEEEIREAGRLREECRHAREQTDPSAGARE